MSRLVDCELKTWYLWNCRALYWTFVSHRLVLFPCWLALWMHDRWMAAQDDKLVPVHYMEGTVYPLTIVGLLALSTIWFQMIGNGIAKQQEAYNQARKGKQI